MSGPSMDFVFSSLNIKKRTPGEIASQKTRIKSHAARFAHAARQRRSQQDAQALDSRVQALRNTPRALALRSPRNKTDSQRSTSLTSDTYEASLSGPDRAPQDTVPDSSSLVRNDPDKALICTHRVGTSPYDFIPGAHDPGAAEGIDFLLSFAQPNINQISESFGVLDFYGTWLVRQMTANPDLSYAVICFMKGSCAVFLRGKRVSYQEIASYQANALSRLRSRLSRDESSEDDSIVMTCLMLSAVDLHLEDRASFFIHRRRIDQMIQHRGGIADMRVDPHIKAALWHWQVILGCSVHENPRQRLPTYPSRPFSPTFNTFIHNLPPGFRDLALTGQLSLESIRVLSNIHRLNNSETTTATTTTSSLPSTPQRGYAYTFPEACPALALPDEPDPPLEKLLCMALLALLCSSMRTYRNCYGWMHHSVSLKLARYLSSSASDSHFSLPPSSSTGTGPERTALLWIWLVSIASTCDSVDVLGPQRAAVAMLKGVWRLFPETEAWTVEKYDAVGWQFFWNGVLSERWRLMLEAVRGDGVIRDQWSEDSV